MLELVSELTMTTIVPILSFLKIFVLVHVTDR